MKRIVLCCSVLVLAVAAACSLPAIARQTPRPPLADSSGLPPRVSNAEPRPSDPLVSAPPLAKAPSIDDLLNKLDSLKAQKAALEKAEKETVELLKEKLRQQKLRLHKLGVHVQEDNPAPTVAPPAPSPTVAPPGPSAN
jgi:hypothetical protein